MSKSFLESLKWPTAFVVLLWVVHSAQWFLGLDLGRYGVFPRAIDGLRGIFLAPLLHSDIYHLISNSLPMLFLGTMLFYFYKSIAHWAFILMYVLTGVVVWFLARPVYHIGASGVVYSLVAFVFWTGIFRRSLRSVVLALVVTILYSGYFAGLLPNQEGISWESHLFGAIVGIFVAYFYKEELELEEKEEQRDRFAHEPDKTFFLQRDTFNKTKEEREQEKQQDDNSDWHSTSTF